MKGNQKKKGKSKGGDLDSEKKESMSSTKQIEAHLMHIYDAQLTTHAF